MSQQPCQPPSSCLALVVPVVLSVGIVMVWAGARTVAVYSGDWTPGPTVGCRLTGVGATMDVRVAVDCLEPEACSVSVVTLVRCSLFFDWPGGRGSWTPEDALVGSFAKDGTPDDWQEAPYPHGLAMTLANGTAWPSLRLLRAQYLRLPESSCGEAAPGQRCGYIVLPSPSADEQQHMQITAEPSPGIRSAGVGLYYGLHVGSCIPCWVRAPCGAPDCRIALEEPARALRAGLSCCGSGSLLVLGAVLLGWAWLVPGSPLPQQRRELGESALRCTQQCLVPQELEPLLPHDEWDDAASA
eukprot:TRINITY_DN70339_c0_g1_i1.p1 TRINITY_DN70339_c0_g1~~TRINITY_DN70339_c0_g1_i1.p1  ORF type:complete len:327 (+),score=81.10 TRINITY_DN70339_c0_g1_i1:85-981(+)